PLQDRPLLAPSATAPQPAHAGDLGADLSPRRPMATACPHPAPLARRPLLRSYPRQEPSALAAHAGICAGGRQQRRSLPRSTSSTVAGGSATQPSRRVSTTNRVVYAHYAGGMDDSALAPDPFWSDFAGRLGQIRRLMRLLKGAKTLIWPERGRRTGSGSIARCSSRSSTWSSSRC